MTETSKIQACTILARNYEQIAKSAGMKKDGVFEGYMERCMQRDDNTVSEQLKREYHEPERILYQAIWLQWKNKRRKHENM